MSDQRILGVDIGGTAVKLVVHDRGVDAIPAGEILRAEIPTDPGDAHETFRRLAAYLAEHCGDFVPQAVGIACAGIVDTDLGRLHRAPNLPDWQGVDLAKVADETWPGCRVVWANDVNAALAGEAAVGAGAGHRDIVMLALGTGVGGAVMLDGRLHTGRRFGAGEIGHMILDPDGPLCECGNRGCLEAYAGAKAIRRDPAR
jgi:glucokinase